MSCANTSKQLNGCTDTLIKLGCATVLIFLIPVCLLALYILMG